METPPPNNQSPSDQAPPHHPCSGQPPQQAAPPPWPPAQPPHGYALSPAAGARKRSKVWMVVLIALLVCSVMVNLGLFAVLSTMSMQMPVTVELIDGHPDADRSVLEIDISGVLVEADPGLFARSNPVDEAIRNLRWAAEDDSVVAVVLSIDSPGGTLTASDRLYREVLRTRETGKPVVVYIRGIGASGAYYLSAPADRIVASRSGIVGSIGVVIRAVNFSGLAQWMRIEPISVASGDNKDMLNPLKEPDPEHLVILNELVQDAFGAFMDIVRRGRNLNETQMALVGDGRVFTATAAVPAGLIDEVGPPERAYGIARELSRRPAANVVRRKTRRGFFDLLSQRMSRPTEAESFDMTLQRLQAPRMMAIWEMGVH